MAATTRKKMTKEQKELCRIVTPEFRVSYPHLFKPQAPGKAKPGDKLKFSITMLFPKDSDLMGMTTTGEPRNLKDVIRNAKIAEFGEKANWPAGLESPVGDGDFVKPGHEVKAGYAGHWVIKASTSEDQRPSVVDRDMSPITDPALIYPGCYARAYIYAYVWEFMGNQGVGFILDHVQKLRDGKSFGGKASVENVFQPVASVEDPAEAASEDDDHDFK